MDVESPNPCDTPTVTDTVTSPVTALQTIDWESVKRDWINGVTSIELEKRYGVTASGVRMRAKRYNWAKDSAIKGAAKFIQEGSEKAAKLLVKRRLRASMPALEKRVDKAIQECIDETVTVSKKLVTEAARRVEGASDRDLSSISTAAKTGVGLWREALGLSAADQPKVTVSLSMEAMGAEAPVTLDV